MAGWLLGRSFYAYGLTALVALAGAPLGCASTPNDTRLSDSGVDSPLLELRVAHEEPGPGRLRVEHNGEVLYLAPEPVIIDRDIVAASARSGEDYVLLDVALRPTSAARLRDVTQNAVGSRMVILFESTIAVAYTIQSALGMSPEMQLQVPVRNPERAAELVRSRWP